MSELRAFGTALYPVAERGVSSPKMVRTIREDYRVSPYGDRPASAFVFYDRDFASAPPRIVRTPGVLGGKPRIAGHRVSVQDVVIWHERLGLCVDEIATKYDLPPDDIRAALRYYADNRPAIDEAIRADEAYVAEMQQRHPSTLKARRDG